MMRGDCRMKGLAATLAVTVLAGATAAAAQTGDWRFLGEDGPVDVALDVMSFSGPADSRTARSVIVTRDGSDPFAYLIVEVVIDCGARTINAVAMTAHDIDGALLRRQDLPPEIVPVTEADGTARTAGAACEGAEVSDTRFESPRAFAEWSTTRPAS